MIIRLKISTHSCLRAIHISRLTITKNQKLIHTQISTIRSNYSNSLEMNSLIGLVPTKSTRQTRSKMTSRSMYLSTPRL